jgi:ribosomal-protein-alanine N-acetyltransferase
MKAVPVRVRSARAGDIDRIIEIERSWVHLSHWSVDAYERLLNEDNFTSSFVGEIETGEEEPAIVGFVIFHVADRISEIYNIAVDRTYARDGVGTYMMNAVIEASRQEGARKLMLEVRKSNSAAIKFYSRFQFSIAGERHNYYSNPVEDAYVMERDLRF